MVDDHLHNGRNMLLPLHGLLVLISSKRSFFFTIPQRVVHTMAFDTLFVEHWPEQEIAQWATMYSMPYSCNHFECIGKTFPSFMIIQSALINVLKSRYREPFIRNVISESGSTEK